MSVAERIPPGACPGCAALPADAAGAVAKGARAPGGEGATSAVELSLPTIHCAACIAGVERGLRALPGVSGVRVNLSRKRVRADIAPGLAPEDLAAHLTALGYEAHPLDPGAATADAAERAARDLLMRLGLAGFAMMNVMLLSVAVWSGASDATRDLFHWISAAIALPTVAISAQPFFRSAAGALSGWRLNMDVPISLAIGLAAGMSLYETAQGGAHAYFDAALSLTFFLLAGRYLDQRARQAARSAAAELSALEVPRALRLAGGVPASVPVSEIAAGDAVLVRPGARVPVDGTVIAGASELDRGLLTGETAPVRVAEGAAVHAGEMNLTGPLTLRVTAAGADTRLHALADLVAVAEEARSRHTSLADRAARIYAPAVHLLALAAFAGWLWASGDLRLAVNIAVAVLIITCPCALGLAVPAVSTVASGRLFRRGLLLKHATALERLAEVDTVVLDKTGTLTLGRPEPLDAGALDDTAAGVALALAEGSAHPLSCALAEALRARGIMPAPLEARRDVPGDGIEARWNGRPVRLGRAGWVGAEPGEETATWLALPGRAPIELRFADRLRPGAAELVAALRRRGLPVTLLSGDGPAAVARVAGQLGIDDRHAGISPEDKARRVAELAAGGRRVLMIGDGLNDTAALAAAHVSIAPASALDAARVAADVVLTGTDLAPVADALRLARLARRRILQNFAIAAAYNLVAIPVALAGLATPLAAALAMSGSSILVSLNALRMR